MFKFIRKFTEFSSLGKNQVHDALASVISDNQLYKESMGLLEAPDFQEFYLEDTKITRSYWAKSGHCLSVVHTLTTLEAYATEWCMQMRHDGIKSFILENPYARMNHKTEYYQELKALVKLYYPKYKYGEALRESTIRAIDTILYFNV